MKEGRGGKQTKERKQIKDAISDVEKNTGEDVIMKTRKMDMSGH